jgi:TolB-like protein/DNA-binding winged helix-turn-helix (wHTH) protein/Tfp pilus assembly protein PilF
MDAPETGPLRFGVFEVDRSTGQVRRHGFRLKLHDKAFQVLLALLERPGEVVSREALRQRLWPEDVFVDFDNNLNNAVSRLRESLQDSAESPRFIETVPRRGYRFIATVEGHASPAPAVPAAAPGALPSGRRPSRFATAAVVALAVTAAAFALLVYRPWSRTRAPLDSLAVLPFVTPEAQDEYLAFGVTEALTAELSTIPTLKVISQTSALQYKGVNKALPQIARELGVAAVLEGSVVREGDRVRVTAQLIDATSDTHLWAGSYTRDVRGLLVMQSEIARAVAREVRVQLSSESQAAIATARTVNPEVHEAYLRGRYYLSQGTESGRTRALAQFERALTIDPGHAPSHAGLANYYAITDSVPATVAMPKAKLHAQRALALDDTLADAHASLAAIHHYGDWDWQAAEAQFRRALELDPGNSRARRWYGMHLSAMGRHAEALEHVQRAVETDPLSVIALDSLAYVWVNARHPDRALEAARRILELNQDDPVGLEHLAIGSILSGKYEPALEAIGKGLAASGRDVVFLVLLAHTQGALSRTADMQATLAELNEAARKGFVPPTLFAIARLGRPDQEAALGWLDKAHELRDPYLVLLKVSPWFDPLRDHPRFQRLLRRMNFPG